MIEISIANLSVTFKNVEMLFDMCGMFSLQVVEEEMKTLLSNLPALPAPPPRRLPVIIDVH
uniref:Uncharacterized protein n=1 Tax=Ascaris lumbricoides TaxID=6252 RepID=A0A0M3HIU8_ASCLU